MVINYFYGIGIVIVHGNSMLPTYESGKTLIYLKTYNNLSVGDVIIYQDKTGDIDNGSYIIKRVTDIDNGKVYLDGDNPEESTDSNDFGYVDEEGIVGKVI